MEKNIILAGVGGQGILSIAYVIDNAALAAGLDFKQAEVHGMAQRGGAVQSNLRYSDGTIHSDLVPRGKADLVISVEPLEVLRYWHFLRPGGWVVASATPYVNIPDYPDLDTLLERIASFPDIVLVDSAQIARAAGNLRAQNMAMIGAASPLLDFSDAELETWVAKLFAGKGQRLVEVNLSAYRYGRAMGQFFRGLVDGGVPALTALSLCQRLDPASVNPELAPAWAESVAGDRSRLDTVLAAEEPIACDAVPA